MELCDQLHNEQLSVGVWELRGRLLEFWKAEMFPFLLGIRFQLLLTVRSLLCSQADQVSTLLYSMQDVVDCPAGISETFPGHHSTRSALTELHRQAGHPEH